ncbi:MAG: serine/threonine-protein kinase [Planctomycetota bacterium]|nr:serine/threonine-protein kinase [Planctomycetota bacterium]
MSDSMVHLIDLSQPQRRQLDEIVKTYKSACGSGSYPNIDRYVPADKSLHLAVLVELIRVDLEFRLKAGESVSVDDYLRRYSELEHQHQIITQLNAAENQIRRQLPTNVASTTMDIESNRRFDTKPTSPVENSPDSQSDPPSTQSGRHETVSDTPSQTTNHQNAAESRQLPREFGRYLLVRQLGKGAMGSVFLAEDRQLKRKVALKIPHIIPGEDRDVLERFFQEARAAATVHHPNLCPVYEVGEVNGTHYLTMAYINGRSLSEFVRTDKQIPERQVARLVHKIALALHEAHRSGVIHRDLKPANIMIDARREPIVMDFGLARLENADQAGLTRTGTILGTPAYMSPEQVRGETHSFGPCCDIYPAFPR